MRKLILTTILATGFLFNLSAQDIISSGEKKLSSKAAAGELVDYTVDEPNNKVTLTYLVKQKKKMLFLEQYEFDMNLKYQNMTPIEIPIEKAERKLEKYEREARIRENQDIRLLKAGANLKGQFVVHKGYLLYTVVRRGVITKFVEEETLRPKGEEGANMILVYYKTQMPEIDGAAITGTAKKISIGVGNIFVIATEKSDPKYTKYASLIIDAKTLNIKQYKTFTFDYGYVPIAYNEFKDGTVGMIFQPLKEDDMTLGVKNTPMHPNPEQYKYVRIGLDGSLIENTDFKFEKTKLGISHALSINELEDGSVLISGVGNVEDKGNFYTLQLLNQLTKASDAPKTLVKPGTHYYSLKMKDGKIIYQNKMNINAIFDNIVVANGSETKLPKLDKAGKFIQSSNFRVLDATSIGDEIILQVSVSGYHMLMHLDKEGNVAAMYTEGTGKQKPSSHDFQLVDGKLYWLMYQHDISTDPEKLAEAESKQYLKMVQLDLNGRKMGELVQPFTGKSFIDNVTPFKEVEGEDNTYIILGNDGGKTIFLKKVKF